MTFMWPSKTIKGLESQHCPKTQQLSKWYSPVAACQKRGNVINYCIPSIAAPVNSNQTYMAQHICLRDSVPPQLQSSSSSLLSRPCPTCNVSLRKNAYNKLLICRFICAIFLLLQPYASSSSSNLINVSAMAAATVSPSYTSRTDCLSSFFVVFYFILFFCSIPHSAALIKHKIIGANL